MPRPAPASAPGLQPMSHKLRVNPIACEAHGMCAELLPERITLDEWGYPVIDDGRLEPGLLDMARRAAQACPTFALLVESETKRSRR
jgi:ferredoxin